MYFILITLWTEVRVLHSRDTPSCIATFTLTSIELFSHLSVPILEILGFNRKIKCKTKNTCKLYCFRCVKENYRCRKLKIPELMPFVCLAVLLNWSWIEPSVSCSCNGSRMKCVSRVFSLRDEKFKVKGAEVKICLQSILFVTRKNSLNDIKSLLRFFLEDVINPNSLHCIRQINLLLVC